jgi:predicted permease
MSTLAQDLRYAYRMLQRSRGFAIVAILTLGLGIGATTTIFTIVNGVLLRPLPYRDPDRIANLWVDFGVGAQSLPAMSPGDFLDYQQRNLTFETLVAASGAQVVGATGALTGTGEPERVDVSPVTANFFPMLGIDPIYGRHFTAEEETPGGPPVVLLGHGLWARRFGGDPSIVGRRIRLDGLDQTVVGVMPRGFHLWLPSEAFLITDSQIWKPLQFNYTNQPPRNFTFFTVMGRLKAGVSFEQAQADLAEIARQLRAEHAEHESGDMHIRVVPLQHDVVKHAEPALLALFGAVAVLLVIACANVAHLLLARATAREREIALRGALGASRARVVRQLVTESLLLACAGGALGLVLAYIGIGVLVRINPANVPRLAGIGIDGGVLLFAMTASALTAVFFGLAPAVRAAGVDLTRTLRAAGSATSTQMRLRTALMVAEMALALVLLVGAGLIIRSFAALQRVQPGFDPNGVLTFRLALPQVKYPADARSAFFRKMEERLRAIPGVNGVGMTSQLPLTGSGPLSPFAYDDATARNWESETSDGRNVSPGFFQAMGTRLVAGRVFDNQDARRPDVIIVDTTLAARAWPGQPAVGKRLQTQPNGSTNRFAEVVGVVEHVRAHDLTRAVRPQIYTPFRGNPRLYVVLRASVDPDSLVAPVRQAMEEIDPELPVDRLRPMTTYVNDGLAQARMNLVIMSMFGAAALLLSSIGVYGVFSYSVGQRTKEIGIRIALGQRPSEVRNMVIAQGLRMIALSTAIGLLVAFVVSRSLSALLYQVNPADALTFGTMAAVLTIVALIGCVIPARRATTINPLVALKTE